jgi:transketolase
MMKKITDYDALAKTLRRRILEIICRTRGPHLGSSFSCVDLLVGLYFHTLKIDPEDPENPQRDRFIFSKGHASPALYAVLFERGFLSQKDMDGFAVNGGTLQQHPDYDLRRGIEVSTGSLGHGLSVGAGMAYALKKDANPARVFVMMSDGEMNEGSTWEAVLFAAHHNLDNLVQKVAAFNWATETIDGHCFPAICTVYDRLPLERGKPNVIVAETVKGKGVSFMENVLHWHYCCPMEEEYTMACRELEK